MSELLKFAAWSDSHYDQLIARCVNLYDIEEVERSILRHAFKNDYDFTLFPGDRFQAREPKDEVKTIADRVYRDYSYNIQLKKKNMYHYHLIGNHDWVDNGLKWHTSMSIGDFPRIQIMEAPCTYLGHDGKPFRIHALPSGYKFSMDYYDIDPNDLNIFVFHDMLMGSYRSDERNPNNIFKSGIPLSEIDRPEFDLVLAGDIHIPQKFPLKRVRNGGGYCGGLVQLNKGEANQKRGWLDIEAYKGSRGWEVKTEFKETRNFFTRVSFGVSGTTRYEDLVIDEKSVEDQLVEVRLVGNKADVDRIADDERWKTYEMFCNARKLDILRAYEVVKNEVSIDMTESKSLLDDLSLYINSGFANLGNLDKNSVIDRLKDLEL